jgi:2,3-bisphosphoglycerate-dependent phosphoglycerate mutase
MAQKVLYLVRHAQSQPSREIPDPQWPLSERGRGQAQRLTTLLTELGVEEVHTSPYLRCRDTVAPFVASAGVPVHEHHDLRERRVAATLIDNFAEVWRRSWEDFSYCLPDCESSHMTQSRMFAAVTAICERSAATVLAISSHGNALSLFLNRLHMERATFMRNPDVFRVTWNAGELRWDEAWRAAILDEWASAHLDTPFPRQR